MVLTDFGAAFVLKRNKKNTQRNIQFLLKAKQMKIQNHKKKKQTLDQFIFIILYHPKRQLKCCAPIFMSIF